MTYTYETYDRRFDFVRPRSRRERVARLDALANLLDIALVVPGTNMRFGLDALIGLVPGIGDSTHHLRPEFSRLRVGHHVRLDCELIEQVKQTPNACLPAVMSVGEGEMTGLAGLALNARLAVLVEILKG